MPPSIREPQSIARLSRTFSKRLSAVDLAEPLVSMAEAYHIRSRGKNILAVFKKLFNLDSRKHAP